MKNKPIIIVAGEPYSVFLEVYFKSLKKKNIKNLKQPILIICSSLLIKRQMKTLKYNYKINEISFNQILNLPRKKNQINVFNVDFKFNKTFDKISSKSNAYLEACFSSALKIMSKYKLKFLINGPISKKHFLKKKYPGMTEYFASKIKMSNHEVMLIYGKQLSVSPITTHVPLKNIFGKISIKKIVKNTQIIHNFYKKNFSKKPRIALTGLNPHCETSNTYSEEKEILEPAIKQLLKKNIHISGPFPADTLFIKKNLKKFNVVIGMYHDQVLTPIKTIYEFKAINITLGLPFLRITPDHGPNNDMLGKNLSNPDSLIEAINFIKSYSAN